MNRTPTRRKSRRVAAAAIILACAAPLPCSADFYGLQDLPGGPTGSIAFALSRNGRYVAGAGDVGFTPDGAPEASMWSNPALSPVPLGLLAGGSSSVAYGISDLGNIAVGEADSQLGNEAFVWTPQGGMVGLGDLPGGRYQSTARGVSANGAVVVGGASGANGAESFRWTTSTGMVTLGHLPGGGGGVTLGTHATAVSADGQVVVGTDQIALQLRAYRWDAASGMVDLGALNGRPRSMALGVSSNGQFVCGCGQAPQGDGDEAFVWSAPQ